MISKTDWINEKPSFRNGWNEICDIIRSWFCFSNDFNHNDNVKDANIAATLLKIQERKTAKGTSYAILKLTDLQSVFELFIFSDLLDLNRKILKDGSSLFLRVSKSVSEEENRFRRINIQKIISLKELFDSPLKKVTFDLKSLNELKEISKFLNDNGDTLINIQVHNKDQNLKFELKNKRNIDRKTLNLLRNKEISAIID